MPQRLILALFLTLLLIVGGGVYFWQLEQAHAPGIEPVEEVTSESIPTVEPETPIDTSDWKTYRNEKYGFEFKYPEQMFEIQEIDFVEPVGLYTSPLPKQLEVRLIEKGYSIDDYKHQIWLSLNTLKSEKESSFESEDGVVEVQVPFSSKLGKFYSHQEAKVTREHQYKLFVDKGICDPETFTIIFDEIDHPDGEFRSYVHVGCEGKKKGLIYRSVYNSFRFWVIKP